MKAKINNNNKEMFERELTDRINVAEFTRRFGEGSTEAVIRNCIERNISYDQFIFDFINLYADDEFFDYLCELCEKYNIQMFDENVEEERIVLQKETALEQMLSAVSKPCEDSMKNIVFDAKCFKGSSASISEFLNITHEVQKHMNIMDNENNINIMVDLI